MSFAQFMLRESYKKLEGLGDRLPLMERTIEWERFRPFVAGVFRDTKELGGRPHTDEIMVVKTMILQACYGLSDPELEFQIHDRLSFRNFLGFPDTIPDFTTIWKIRERLQQAGAEKEIWNELQQQLKEKGYAIRKGVIQDATFIEADVGRKRRSHEKKHRDTVYTKKQKSHMDHDGTFAVKHNQVHYGYKSHLKSDVDHHLIREYEVTTASLHDSQIDLVEEGDVAAWRDKGYFGKELCAEGVIDKTMKRATRARKLNGGELKRNKLISGVRSPGERPFAVVKRVFKGGRTLVKRLERVSIKEMLKCFAYNLYQLVTLQRKLA